MNNLYAFSIDSQSHFGLCEQCNNLEDLYTVVISHGEKEKRMTVCRQCAVKVKRLVDHKNAAAAPQPQPASESDEPETRTPQDLPVSEALTAEKNPKADLTEPTSDTTSKTKKESSVFYKIAIALILLVSLGGILLFGFALPGILTQGVFPIGYASYEKAVNGYIKAAYGNRFIGSDVTATMQKDVFSGLCAENQTTEAEANEALTSRLNAFRDNVASFTFSNAPKPKDVRITPEYGSVDSQAVSSLLSELGCEKALNDVVMVQIELGYMFSLDLSGADLTEWVLVAQLGNRWYVLDSELLSEVFPSSF